MLLKANPYQRFGGTPHSGKTHKLNDDLSKTLCGKTRDIIPGDMLNGEDGNVDCKGCLIAIQSRARRAEQSAKWEMESRKREQEKAEQSALWWERYNAYLLTPGWRSKRDRVLQRAHGLCEGCGAKRAVYAHHLTYERVFNEMLFDLVALCDECHQTIHPDKDLLFSDV